MGAGHGERAHVTMKVTPGTPGDNQLAAETGRVYSPGRR
jgi:hypothetical protein